MAKDFKPPKAFWYIIVVSFALAIVVFACYGIAFHHHPFSTDPTDWEAFGGYIGGTLGAVFGFAGFAALLYTIFMQREELALSREELAATREELARSAKAQEQSKEQFKKQSRLMEIQKFESRLFELLRAHRENVENTEYRDKKGRVVFVEIISQFRKWRKYIDKVIDEIGCFSTLTKRNKMILCCQLSYLCLYFGVGNNSSRILFQYINNLEYDRYLLNFNSIKHIVHGEKLQIFKNNGLFTDGHISRLGYYFRGLYQTICYIDNSKILSNDEKYEYAKLVRSQLSDHEQGLLLLNTLTPLGEVWWYDDENSLIKKYKMISNLPREFFCSSSEIDVLRLFCQGYFEWAQNNAPAQGEG